MGGRVEDASARSSGASGLACKQCRVCVRWSLVPVAFQNMDQSQINCKACMVQLINPVLKTSFRFLAWLKGKRKPWPAAGDGGKHRRARRRDGLPTAAPHRTRAHAAVTTLEKLMREECSAPATPAVGAPPSSRPHRHQAGGGIREHRWRYGSGADGCARGQRSRTGGG